MSNFRAKPSFFPSLNKGVFSSMPIIILFSIFLFIGCTTEGPSQNSEIQAVENIDLTLDPSLALYRDVGSRTSVIGFFTSLAGSDEIASSIMTYADINSIPFPLAFALAYEESKFSPKAIRKNKGSIDRGLFQLNSKSFPNLAEKDFFNVRINSRYGLSHLRFCFSQAGNEVTALAMYNAGTGRVNKDSTPKTTLDYIARVIDTKQRIDSVFRDSFLNNQSVNMKKGQKITFLRINPLT
jgi:hypothetical protein